MPLALHKEKDNSVPFTTGLEQLKSSALDQIIFPDCMICNAQNQNPRPAQEEVWADTAKILSHFLGSDER